MLENQADKQQTALSSHLDWDMALVEKLLEDLPKDADTLRHVQEWVNSAVTGDDTDGAESED